MLSRQGLPVRTTAVRVVGLMWTLWFCLTNLGATMNRIKHQVCPQSCASRVFSIRYVPVMCLGAGPLACDPAARIAQAQASGRQTLRETTTSSLSRDDSGVHIIKPMYLRSELQERRLHHTGMGRDSCRGSCVSHGVSYRTSGNRNPKHVVSASLSLVPTTRSAVSSVSASHYSV